MALGHAVAATGVADRCGRVFAVQLTPDDS